MFSFQSDVLSIQDAIECDDEDFLLKDEFLPYMASPLVVRQDDDVDDIEILPPDLFLNDDEVKPEMADSLIAKNLNALSMADREKVFYDLHGISDNAIEETPQLIAEQLERFESALATCVDLHGYSIAMQKDASYVRSPRLRLRFLRADRFDAHKAANQFAQHFNIKLDLFGEDLVAKDLTQDDLDEETLRSLYDGSCFELPLRDRAGRLVVIFFRQPASISVRAVMKKIFYSSMVFTEDDETQKSGIVGVSYLVGQPMTWQQMAERQAANRKWGELLSLMPFRVAAMHICFDSIMWRSVLAIFKIAASLFWRLRIREHFGSHQEAMFQLQTYGIPTYLFPIGTNGELLREPSANRWRKRRALERRQKFAREARANGTPSTAEAQGARVGTPSTNDVLLGRGKSCYMHIGNIRLRNRVLELATEYDEAEYKGKQEVSREVVQWVQNQGGRFLKDDGCGWIEVDDRMATGKVAHNFRSLRGIKSWKIGVDTSAKKTIPQRDSGSTIPKRQRK